MKNIKTRNGGLWTEARFISFVKGTLRSASMRWGPKNETKKQARVARGFYQCQGYNTDPHIVPASVRKGARRVNNVVVDHIKPIVDPSTGFQGWDAFITGLFCEIGNLQVLCNECHTNKTNKEKEERKNTNDPQLL